MYDIVLGRAKQKTEQYGTQSTVLLGRQYVQMGRSTALSNNVHLDFSTSHAISVFGKRGSGKSYTLGVVAEGILEKAQSVNNSISAIIFDTMGIYWTMKYPNHKDESLLNEWKLKGKPVDITIFTPLGSYDDMKQKGIPVDQAFSIKTSDLNIDDWLLAFELEVNARESIIITKAINDLKKTNQDYDIPEIINYIEAMQDVDPLLKRSSINMFENAMSWKLFTKQGFNIAQLINPGNVSVLDISVYSTYPNAWKIKNLVVGIVSKRLFNERMKARKSEEIQQVEEGVHFFSKKIASKMPLIWLILDEAHEFLPNDYKTGSTDSLITILREGRQPGISLVMASQQPGKIHTDVMTQSDIILSHRLTSQIDIEALSKLMQSYLRKGLNLMIDSLPRLPGAALIIDDQNEHMYQVQVRPRFSWHGGSAPDLTQYLKTKDEKLF